MSEFFRTGGARGRACVLCGGEGPTNEEIAHRAGCLYQRIECEIEAHRLFPSSTSASRRAVAEQAKALGIALKFRYRLAHSIGGAPSVWREILPQKVEVNTVGGFDYDRKEYRTFRFDAMVEDPVLAPRRGEFRWFILFQPEATREYGSLELVGPFGSEEEAAEHMKRNVTVQDGWLADIVESTPAVVYAR